MTSKSDTIERLIQAALDVLHHDTTDGDSVDKYERDALRRKFAAILKPVNHDELVEVLRLAQGYISYDTDIPKADEILVKIGRALDPVGGSR